MSFSDRLTHDLQQAMKAKDQLRMDVIRMIKAAIQRREIELKRDLDDAEMSRVMTSLIKQGRESVEQFEKARREDLATKERQEISIIEGYLPKALSTDELAQLVETVIREFSAPTMKDMGTVMKAIMVHLGGRPADGKVVSDLVRSKLSSSA